MGEILHWCQKKRFRKPEHSSKSKIVAHWTPSAFIFFLNIVQCVIGPHYCQNISPALRCLIIAKKWPWESIYCTNLWSLWKAQCSNRVFISHCHLKNALSWNLLTAHAVLLQWSNDNLASCWLTSNRCLLFVKDVCYITLCVSVNICLQLHHSKLIFLFKTLLC